MNAIFEDFMRPLLSESPVQSKNPHVRELLRLRPQKSSGSDQECAKRVLKPQRPRAQTDAGFPQLTRTSAGLRFYTGIGTIGII